MDNIEKQYEDFISTVSHELRTPLTSIRGFSQTMLSSWEKLDDENKKKFIKIIEEQSNRLIHLVENMLSVSKLQNPNNHLIYNDVEVIPQIEKVITILKSQYPNHVFEITSSKILESIFVDKDKFQQIITNLLENSAKYSINKNITEINVSTNSNNIDIEVSNFGINLNEEDKKKIFTKFARVDCPLTRKVQGSGLGLYITKSLVEKMQGNIIVESTIQEENSNLAKITFKVSFPILNIEQKTRLKCAQ